VARRPGSGVGCPRSSPSRPPACRPSARKRFSSRDYERFGTPSGRRSGKPSSKIQSLTLCDKFPCVRRREGVSY
jgi:hypothetical protein